MAYANPAFCQAVRSSSPHILESTIINPYVGEVYFTIRRDEILKGYKEPVITCTPGIVSIFDFQLVEGSLDCLDDPEKCLLPESMARKIFGESSAIGKEFACGRRDLEQGTEITSRRRSL